MVMIGARRSLLSARRILSDPDARAWVNAQAAKPPSWMWPAINRFFVGIKATTVWAKLPVLYLYPFEYAAAPTKFVNAKTPGTFDGNASAGITHVPGQFTQGDGSAAFIGTGWNPATVGGRQNAMGLGAWCLTPDQEGKYICGNLNSRLQPRGGTDNINSEINGTANAAATGITDGSGFLCAERTGSTGAGQATYKDGAAVSTTGATTSATPTNANITFLANVGNTSYSARKFIEGHISLGLTAGENASLYSLLKTLFDSCEIGLTTVDQLIADRVYQRVSGTYDLALSGTYRNSPSAIEAVAVDATTGVPVMDWAVVDNSLSGSLWSGTLTGIPAGGWYNIETRQVA